MKILEFFKESNGKFSIGRLGFLILIISISVYLCTTKNTIDWSGVSLAIAATGALKVSQKYVENGKN